MRLEVNSIEFYINGFNLAGFGLYLLKWFALALQVGFYAPLTTKVLLQDYVWAFIALRVQVPKQ